MKRTITCSLFALAFLGIVGGCVTKIQVIDDSTSTNKVQRVESGFNEESYIWESWLFSTNKVVK